MASEDVLLWGSTLVQAQAYIADSHGSLLAIFDHYSVKTPAELSNFGEIYANVLPKLMPKWIRETINANQQEGRYPEGYLVTKFSYQSFVEVLVHKSFPYTDDVQFEAWLSFMAVFDKHRISTDLYLVVSEWT